MERGIAVTDSSSVIDSIVIICAEQSDRPATPTSTLIDDLGFDSLDCVELCLQIEAQYPTIGNMDYDPKTMSTVQDVADYVLGQLNQAAPVAE
jgi:acyl carrier protein